MILGVGTDIVEVARIAAALEKTGQRFLERILLPEELAYCRSHRSCAPQVAARFAAKEAVSKAFGTGMGSELGWLDIEICRRSSGQPWVLLHGKGKTLFEKRGARQLLLSLSHTDRSALAFAVLSA